MTNRIHDAVVTAIKDAQVSGALAEIVQKAILDANQKSYDPYRTTIHFLIGLIAFCLSVIVGIFHALPDPPVCTYTLTYHMLGGVLAWISITAFVASVCAAGAQYLKHLYRVEQLKGEPGPAVPKERLLVLMALPIMPGAFAVIYCVGAGLAILNDNRGPLKSLCVICKLWPF
ncbi:MAG: hypothetical protein HY018_03640 [Hydrogenophilales bacterium]|nr:hypothetical protein [Hydrogenophilales bacterium]